MQAKRVHHILDRILLIVTAVGLCALTFATDHFFSNEYVSRIGDLIIFLILCDGYGRPSRFKERVKKYREAKNKDSAIIKYRHITKS